MSIPRLLFVVTHHIIIVCTYVRSSTLECHRSLEIHESVHTIGHKASLWLNIAQSGCPCNDQSAAQRHFVARARAAVAKYARKHTTS